LLIVRFRFIFPQLKLWAKDFHTASKYRGYSIKKLRKVNF